MMTNISLCLNKEEFEKNSKNYLKEYDKNDYEDKGTIYQIDKDIDLDTLEINDRGIGFSGNLEDSGHYVSIDVELDDEDFLNLLKIVLSKMNKWKEAMKAIETVKEVEIKKKK